MKNMKFENIISSKGYGWLTERITKQTAPGCGPYSIDDDAFDYLANEDVRDTELDEFCEYLYTEHEEPEDLDLNKGDTNRKKITDITEELKDAYQMLTGGYTEEQWHRRAEVDRARLDEAQALCEEATYGAEHNLYEFEEGLTETEYLDLIDDFGKAMSQLESRIEYMEDRL